MIPTVRHKVPLRLDLSSTPLVELAFPTCIPTPVQAPVKPRVHAEVGRYRLRLAETAQDREAACRLRFKVFNIELGEGLESSYQTGIDTDRFDSCCEHLLVEDKLEDNPIRRIVGTYRMQSGTTADMLFSVGELIAFTSRHVTLRPGDVILTGTPDGVGMARKPPIYMLPGATVTARIEGLGSITNSIVDSSQRG